MACSQPLDIRQSKTILARSCEAGAAGNSTTEKWGTNFRQRKVVGYSGLMWDWCAGAASWYGAVVSAGTRKGSTSEWLAQESSAITTTESAETRIIDFFMAGNCR